MRLANQRYEQIKRTVANLLDDYDIRRIPVDVFDLAEKMKIKVVFAKELIQRYPKKIDKYRIFEYPNSYLYYNLEEQKFIVYIDDIGTKKERQRFSLAHEIMHIVLGHYEQSEENEAEANFGATYLLAPTSLALIHLDNDYLQDVNLVSKIFNVSTPEAAIIVRYNINRITYCDLNETSYERTINQLLKESLNKRIQRYR